MTSLRENKQVLVNQNQKKTSRFDNCSQTPYVYNPNTQIMVAYDNAQSFTAKGNFIKQSGLAGYALWEMGSDYNNILLNAINGAISGSS
jgi:chitinase